jgi:trehalose 6-phosphate phosphatase
MTGLARFFAPSVSMDGPVSTSGELPMLQNDLPLPGPADAQRFAFFFDFDGTLADIAEHPEDVEVTGETRDALSALRDLSGGAAAIITGRDIASIDHFLAPLRLPIAGVHGLTRRDAKGRVHSPEIDEAALVAIAARLEPLAAREAGLLLERKHGALAFHYRKRPELEDVCIEAMEQAAADFAGMNLRRGKMVIEAVAHSSDKGAAIQSFMDEEPFRGRIPVFAGDDLTDEDGFAFVNGQGGLSIKVGPGGTLARHRADGREGLLAWLNQIIDQIRKNP